jgi:hypothetical protein
MTDTTKRRKSGSFTTEKRSDSFLFKASSFKYKDGRRAELERDGIFVELNRGVEFNPKAFLAAFKGYGWRPGEALKLLNDLVEALERRAEDRSTRVCYWEDRIRPDAQVRLEGELAESEDLNSKLLEILEKAGAKNPEILELKRKVLGDAVPA